jgi:hypothetical protein
VCACATVAVAPANAAAAKSLIGPVSSHDAYGYGATKTTDAQITGEPFKTALVFTNATAGKNSWDSGAAIGFTAGAAKGDKIVVTFYLRAVKPSSGKVEISIEQPAAPYVSIGRQTFSATKSWQKETYSLTATAPFTDAQEHLLFHTAFAAQTIEVGGLTIVDKGK